MKSDHPLGGYCFGLRLFSPDFIISILQNVVLFKDVVHLTYILTALISPA